MKVQIHLDQLLEELRLNLLQMANMVKEAITYSTKALFEKDAVMARAVIDKDNQIDSMENNLDEEALKIFALQQPIAVDLRFVVMVLKMNNDFERIGDSAVNISERVLHLIEHNYHGLFDELNNYQELKYMANKSAEMINLALQSIIEKNAALAREVIKMDQLVDSYNKSIILKCIAEINNKGENADFYINLITVSKNLERVADHATNVAQDVIYMVEGKNVKHKNINEI